MQEALSKLLRDKTVLIIAHRMRTVAASDKIVVLQDGKIAEQGQPEELLEHGTIYKNMVELQQKTTAWKIS
ncbi:ABC-type multidrug transport system fused ATPase/permease subunit [Clostridiales Family XIII bacterium PM5-7]